MSGAEIAIPIALFCTKLFIQYEVSLLDINNDAQAFVMLEENVLDDIEDAYLFHRKLMRYVGKERQLKKRAMASIHGTEKAVITFHKRLKQEGVTENLKFALSNRRAARSLLRPLQSAQSNLARRIDWMRSALDALANSAEEEGELASSVAPGVEHE